MPNKDHYIPELLIKSFAMNPDSKNHKKVYVLNKRTKTIEDKGKEISDICFVHNFNTPAQDKRLRRLENKFDLSLQKYLNNEHDECDIMNLKYFACLLLCGTPNFRKILITTITEHIDNVYGLPIGTVKVMNDVKGKFDWTENCAKALFREIEGWEGLSFVIDKPVFISSNSPVVVNNRENGHFQINMTSLKKSENIVEQEEQDTILSFGITFEVANVDLQTDPWIHFPVSPNHLLVFALNKDTISEIRSDFDSVKSEYDSPRKENLIRDINTFTLAHSEDYAISSKRELLEMVKPLINFAPEIL